VEEVEEAEEEAASQSASESRGEEEERAPVSISNSALTAANNVMVGGRLHSCWSPLAGAKFDTFAGSRGRDDG
jgi:hypothetical protein